MEATGQNKSNTYIFIALLCVISIGVIFKYFFNSHEEKALRNSKKTWAIVNQGVSCGKGCLIRYRFLDDKGHEFSSKYGGKQIQECHKKLKEGDTIFIKYAISDPEITEMIHCYWNDEIREEWLNSKK